MTTGCPLHQDQPSIPLSDNLCKNFLSKTKAGIQAKIVQDVRAQLLGKPANSFDRHSQEVPEFLKIFVKLRLLLLELVFNKADLEG